MILTTPDAHHDGPMSVPFWRTVPEIRGAAHRPYRAVEVELAGDVFGDHAAVIDVGRALEMLGIP
jgi:hypothetical protein